MIKKYMLCLAVAVCLLPSFSQVEVAAKVFVVNSGKFETAAPFSDQVSVGVYGVQSGSYQSFDTINAQSAQAASLYKNNLFVAAENIIAVYDAKSNTRIATAAYSGVAAHSIAASNSFVVVGNWYGHNDSGLYIYNRALVLQHITSAISRDVKAIAIDQHTAYVAQNIPGTIDGCAPFGCYTDSIGYVVKVDLATNQLLDTLWMDTAIAGINSLFIDNGKLVAVAEVASSVLVYDLASSSFQVFRENGLKKGLSLSNNQLGIVGKQDEVFYYNIANQSKTIRNSRSTPFAVTTVADRNTDIVFQTLSDYATYGALRIFDGLAKDDTVVVGISPENIVVYYERAYPVLANDDYYTFAFNIDSLLTVKANDTDTNTLPSTISLLSGPKVLGAIATVIGDKIHYTPAIGLIINDTLTYALCNAANQCDTATVYLQLKGVTNTAVNEIDFTVAVYPNPFSETITIKAAERIDELRLIAADGKTMYAASAASQNHELNTAALANGVYYLYLHTAEKSKVIKLVK